MIFKDLLINIKLKTLNEKYFIYKIYIKNRFFKLTNL